MISIPESVSFYWADPTNRAAVNVLADGGEVPPDLTLDEAERFVVAALASQRVRVDLWRLLRSIWSATWEVAIRAEFPSARLQSYGEHVDNPESRRTSLVNQVWEDGTNYGIFSLPGRGRIVTFVRLIGNDQDLELGFSFADQNEHWTVGDELELGPNWTTDDQGWRVAGAGHVRLAGGEAELDPASLAELCRSAMVVLKAALT